MGSVQIIEHFYIPQLKKTRRVWVYLPNSYEKTKRKFPVLYMHDGQNLFYDEESHSGAWKVDEAIDTLSAIDENYEVIVVGIDNGGEERLHEYNPWYIDRHKFGGKGNQYLDFIVHTLKPFMDKKYRTKPDREHTGIAGSSLGGYISIYAAVKYQEIFGKVAGFSNALWHDDKLLVNYIKQHKLGKSVKFYLDTGECESDDNEFNRTTIEEHREMYSILKEAGVERQEIKLLIDPTGVHNEKFWKKRFPDAFRWLYK
ncbi:alpha/beta hydrolase [Bacillus timonensis]|nr:alpha/beta hydrolase [Bacillus timonensis]